MDSYIQTLVDRLNIKFNDRTLTMSDLDAPITCPVCGNILKGASGFRNHLLKSKDDQHKEYYKENIESIKRLNGLYIMINDLTYKKPNAENADKVAEIKGSQNIVETNNDVTDGGKNMAEDNNPTNKPTQTASVETTELPDVYVELKNILLAVLGPKNIQKINGIIWLFQRQEDYKDIEALDTLLNLSGIAPGYKKIIHQQWASYIGVDPDKSDKTTEPSNIPKKPAESVDDFLADKEESIKRRISSEIELRKLATEAARYGIDLSDYGLTDIVPKKQQREVDEDAIDDFEYPPGSGRFVHIKTSTYMKYMQQWNASHKGRDDEKEETEPWENPYTHVIMDVPKSKLPQYLAITQRYEELHKSKSAEEEDTMPWENPYTHEIMDVPKNKLSQYLAITQRYEELHKQKEKAEEKEETVPWENPYDHSTVEVPKSKYPQYLSITQRYNETAKNTAKNENEERVPWEDPVTKKVIEVPIDKLHYYMNISANHAKVEGQSEFDSKLEQMRRENADKLNEIKSSYEKILDSSKKDMDELSKKLDEKEKEKLYGYIGSLQDKLEKLEKKDDLQEVTQKYDEIRNFLTRLGYTTQEQSLKDQAEIKKIDVQANALSKGVDVVVEQAKQFGVPLRTLLNSLGPVVQDEARNLLQQRRAQQLARAGTAVAGQEIPYSEHDLIELEKRLDATGKVQEQATAPVSHPAPEPIKENVKEMAKEPKHEKPKSQNIIVNTEEYKDKKQGE